MKKILLVSGLASIGFLSAAGVRTAEACDKHAASTEAALKMVTVAEVAAMKPADRVVVDANNADTRKSIGIIPGAILLSSSSNFDVKELSVAKTSKLVFYCYNEQCSASHAAAKRARENGFADVAVLGAGIMGWKAAGKPLAQVAAAKS